MRHLNRDHLGLQTGGCDSPGGNFGQVVMKVVFQKIAFPRSFHPISLSGGVKDGYFLKIGRGGYAPFLHIWIFPPNGEFGGGARCHMVHGEFVCVWCNLHSAKKKKLSSLRLHFVSAAFNILLVLQSKF